MGFNSFYKLVAVSIQRIGCNIFKGYGGLFNQVIAHVCDSYENVHLVDIHSAFLGHGIHCRDRRNPYFREDDPHYWYFDNLEDPNDRGYDAIRRLFLLEMIRAFS